jgi:hypothetical protein
MHREPSYLIVLSYSGVMAAAHAASTDPEAVFSVFFVFPDTYYKSLLQNVV